MSPRSILKRSSARSSETQAPQHAVHFPPSPALCSTFSAYSPSTYDRSPIVVTKNTCALPERGGRTYHLDESSCPRSPARNAYASQTRYPRAMHDDRRVAVPQLIPDISSSESDESDTFSHSPNLYTQPSPFHYSYGAHGLPTKYEYDSSAYTPCDDSNAGINALAFLPYPPSPPAYDDKARRRRRPNDASQDLGRIRNTSSTSSTEEERVPAPSPPKKRSNSRRREYLSKLAANGSTSGLCSSFSTVNLQDDGCLGGF